MALHREREPWGLSYFEVLSDLLRLETTEFPAGVKPQPSMWFSSSALVELDEATTQQVRRDLKDWVDLSEPLRSGRSPWTGAAVSSEEEARSALDMCSGVAGELTSSWQVQRNLLAGKLGIDDPGSIAHWGELMAEVPELALAVAKTETGLTLGIFSADLSTLIQHLAPATGSGLEMLSDYLEIDKLRSAVEWGNLIAEVPDLARAVARAEESLTLEVFNQDLDKLVQDMAPATGSQLGRLPGDLGVESRRRFDGGVAVGWLGKFLDDLEDVKPRSAVEWGNLIAEVPDLARAVARAEESQTLEVFNQDLNKLVQDMAPATGSQLGRLAEVLGFDKPRSAVEWGNLIAEVPDLARAVARAEESLTLEVFNQDLNKLVQDMAPATGNSRSRLFNKLFNRRFRSALSELESLKPGSSSRNAHELLEEVEAARTLTDRWAELGCSGSPQVLADAVDASDEIAEFARRYQSALSELESLKPGSSSRNARELLEEVEAARTVAHRWTELGCSGSPQVLATMSVNVHNEIAECARRYQSALSELESLKPGSSSRNARELLEEVEAARTVAHRWTELGCSGSPQVLANTIDAADEIAEISLRYQSALSELEGLIPSLSTCSARNLLEEVEAAHALALQWTELGCSGSPKVLTNAVEASEAFSRMKDAVDQLTILLPGSRLVDETTEEISSLVQELLNDQHTLFQLPQLHGVEQRLLAADIGPLLDQVTKGTLGDDALETAFAYSRLRSIQREILLEDSRLSGFQGSRQNRYVGEFQQADTKHIEGNPARVARRIAEHAVAALNRNPGQDQLIRKEAGKKTRHLPLRSMFELAPEALAAVRPCWAMSPLDVAQTLPPRPLFDLVVFDEASQVLPCDAIPALLRGRRAMVAGDSRQLPPTTFFDSSGGDDDLDEEDDSMADYDSILEVMDAQLSRRQLTWHYRSQDERLIAYSNQEIYHGSLTTFPGAGSDKCLSWELVPHRMGEATKKGSNSDEVLQVVDLMIGHARARPDETLGVIAMGINHANRIEEELRQRLEKESDPLLEDFFNEANEERAFVKNLERVQGDERDAIILSIGYGKNANGKMLHNFGPLNREGGERRLNVAITRARKRMTVVSSFDYADMDPEKTRSTGAKMLRGFLKFAQSGGTALDSADSTEPLNPFEVDVLDKLTAAGLAVVPQYGCSGYRIDFAVRHPTIPGKFTLAVEADGASYHSSPTARDRDRLRQEHLERLGWRFCRIWSTDWFNDHRREVERVLVAYEKAMEVIDTGVEDPPNATDQSEEPASELGTIAPPKPADPSPSRDLKPFMRSHGVSSINDISHHELVALVQWINSDGLLRTNEQLFEEVFAELPFNRRGAKINAAILRAIAAATDSEESMETSGVETKQERQRAPNPAAGSSAIGSGSQWARHDYSYDIVGGMRSRRVLELFMSGAMVDKYGMQLQDVRLHLVVRPDNRDDHSEISVQCEGLELGRIAHNQAVDIHEKLGDKVIAGVEVDGLVTGRNGRWRVELDLNSIS